MQHLGRSQRLHKRLDKSFEVLVSSTVRIRGGQQPQSSPSFVSRQAVFREAPRRARAHRDRFRIRAPLRFRDFSRPEKLPDEASSKK
jgi:hypothetical protein